MRRVSLFFDQTMYIFYKINFPPFLRNSGLGSCSLVARIGGVLANAVGDLAEIHVNLPIAMFGSAAVISSILSILLPETAGKPLANTVAECQLVNMNFF